MIEGVTADRFLGESMRILVGLILASLLAGQGAAQIDQFAAMPRIWHADISPNGSHLATGCSPRGVREICIYDLVGDTAPVVIPAPDGGEMSAFSWPSDEYLVYYVHTVQTMRTSGGLRTRTLSQPVSYSLATGRSNLLLVNSSLASPLIGTSDRVAMEITFLLDDTQGGLIRARQPGDFGTVVYEMNLENGGRARRLEVSSGQTIGFVLDQNGETILDVRYDDDTGEFSILQAGPGPRREIYSGNYPSETPRIFGLVDGGSAVAISFPVEGLRRMNVETGALTDFSVPDIARANPIVDDYAMSVVGFSYTDDLPRQMFTNPELAGLLAEIQQILTEDSVTISAWNADWTKLVIEARDMGRPTNYYLLDLASGGLGLLDVEVQFSNAEAAGVRSSIVYEASDGLAIPGYVTLPPGQTSQTGPFPLIVMPHGGPQSRDTGEYDWWASFYASLGYAVLQPNFRGSSGYGHEFVEAGHGGFGTRMIDDLIDGARYLQNAGIADPGSYCAAGASYGGYAALMLALRDSEDVACVISFAGVTDPFAIMESSSALDTELRYWEQYTGSRYGSSAEQAVITPVERAGEYRAPLLILHGNQDTTVPFGQFRLLRDAIGNRPDVRFVEMDGADHYLGNPDARATLLRESQAFLEEHFPAD